MTGRKVTGKNSPLLPCLKEGFGEPPPCSASFRGEDWPGIAVVAARRDGTESARDESFAVRQGGFRNRYPLRGSCALRGRHGRRSLRHPPLGVHTRERGRRRAQRFAATPPGGVKGRYQPETSRFGDQRQLAFPEGLGGVPERLADVLPFEIRERGEISSSVMPSATMPTTVETGIRSPRIQGTPPICLGLTVILVNLTLRILLITVMEPHSSDKPMLPRILTFHKGFYRWGT